MPGIKTLNATFTEEQHEQLDEIKGDRTWSEAVLEEFGVTDGDN